jgi:tetratricopeptide (TPR) repeat protein
VISPWWPSLIEDQVKLSEFAATEYLLGSLARDGWTAGLLYARGELYRARGKKGDFESAESYYREAIGKDEALSESWRGLGLALLRQGKAEEGRKALRKYLANTPGAGDRAMIGMMAQEPSK